MKAKEPVEKAETDVEKAKEAEEGAKAAAEAIVAAAAALPATPTVLARGKHTTSEHACLDSPPTHSTCTRDRHAHSDAPTTLHCRTFGLDVESKP